MNKIRMIANRETNFVFHMLSAAQCGYDNPYGRKYRKDYPEQLLNTLKKHEQLITCSGGNHWGKLYAPFISIPARGSVRAKEYYQEFLRKINSGESAEYYIDHRLFRPAAEIADTMSRCYDHYISQIWPNDMVTLEAYIAETMPLFERSELSARAEDLVGCKLPAECFLATMVASIEDGAEAIDISDNQDVFGIARAPEWAFRFISHEFIIFLLKRALQGEDAFRRLETWGLTEGLAEYYCKQLTGYAGFPGVSQYTAFYEAQEKNASSSAVELYRKALATFLPRR